MPYLLAAHVNDAGYMPSLLYALGPTLRTPGGEAEGETWGVGYYADRRPLIIKKPAEIMADRTVFGLAPKVLSRTLVASAQRSAVRDQAPPYRFRRWLLTYTGDVSPLERLQGLIVERLPSFLRTELGSGTGGQLLFAMVLAELYRAGLLENPVEDFNATHDAVRRAADGIRGLSSEAENGPVQAGFVLTPGKGMHAASIGASLHWKIQAGLERLPEGPPDPSLNDFHEVAAALKRFKAVIVARHIERGASDWSPLTDASLRINDEVTADIVPQ
ncbi:MAG: hypothetical protein AAFN74_09650 [Myxococcota bacterium]